MSSPKPQNEPEGRSRYSCSECGKHYATSSNLSRHKQTHRSPDSQLAKKCPTCSKVSSSAVYRLNSVQPSSIAGRRLLCFHFLGSCIPEVFRCRRSEGERKHEHNEMRLHSLFGALEVKGMHKFLQKERFKRIRPNDSLVLCVRRSTLLLPQRKLLNMTVGLTGSACVAACIRAHVNVGSESTGGRRAVHLSLNKRLFNLMLCASRNDEWIVLRSGSGDPWGYSPRKRLWINWIRTS